MDEILKDEKDAASWKKNDDWRYSWHKGSNLPLSVKRIYLRRRGKSTSMLRTVGLRFCATKCDITARSGVTSTFSDWCVNNSGHGNIHWLQGKDFFEFNSNQLLLTTSSGWHYTSAVKYSHMQDLMWKAKVACRYCCQPSINASF